MAVGFIVVACWEVLSGWWFTINRKFRAARQGQWGWNCQQLTLFSHRLEELAERHKIASDLPHRTLALLPLLAIRNRLRLSHCSPWSCRMLPRSMLQRGSTQSLASLSRETAPEKLIAATGGDAPGIGQRG